MTRIIVLPTTEGTDGEYHPSVQFGSGPLKQATRAEAIRRYLTATDGGAVPHDPLHFKERDATGIDWDHVEGEGYSKDIALLGGPIFVVEDPTEADIRELGFSGRVLEYTGT